MPFEHALVSLDDGRRLSAAENPPLRNSRAHRIFSELGADPFVQDLLVRARGCGSPLWPRVPPRLLVLSRSELAVARLVAG